MKLRRCITLVLALFIMTRTVWGFADDKVVKSQLKETYGRLHQALKKKDIAACMRLMASDVTWTWPSGETSDRKQIEAAFHESTDSTESVVSSSFTLDKLTMGPGGPVTLMSGTTTRIAKGASGKQQRVKSSSKRRVVWVKTKDGWKIKHIDVLKQDIHPVS